MNSSNSCNQMGLDGRRQVSRGALINAGGTRIYIYIFFLLHLHSLMPLSTIYELVNFHFSIRERKKEDFCFGPTEFPPPPAIAVLPLSLRCDSPPQMLVMFCLVVHGLLGLFWCFLIVWMSKVGRMKERNRRRRE